MKCWHCKEDLIWDSDSDLDHDEKYLIVSYLHCPNCESFVEVYYPRSSDAE